MYKPADLPKEDKAKRAMQTRAQKMGTNKIDTDETEEMDEPDMYDDFAMVHDLVAESYASYADGKHSLKQCLLELASKLGAAARKLKDDNVQAEDVEEDDEF